VLARRGALPGGAPAATIVLPSAPVPPGAYRLTVRLVNQANPGPLTVETSPPLTR
jgi:hypothetical protein